MTREIAHQKSFEKALYSIEPNFPTGKLQGDPRFTSVYFNMSTGDGDMSGSWNKGDNWTVMQADEAVAVDGGTGMATMQATDAEIEVLNQMALRTQSNPLIEPLTGAELGMTEDALASMQNADGTKS